MVSTLDASEMLASGVKVAVQVIPPSPETKADNTPFGLVMSAVVKLLIASLKVKVTVDVSPIFKALSERVTAEAKTGRTVSIA